MLECMLAFQALQSSFKKVSTQIIILLHSCLQLEQ